MSLRLSAVDADEFRRRREDNMFEIRKNRREESLQKEKLENLPAMVAGVLSDDNNMQLQAITRFRKLLSIEGSPPIEEVIQSGVVPYFVEFLVRDDFPHLQFEAAWALTIIALETMGGPLWFRPVPPINRASSVENFEIFETVIPVKF